MSDFITAEQLKEISKNSMSKDEKQLRANIDSYMTIIKDKIKSNSFRKEVKKKLMDAANNGKKTCKVKLIDIGLWDLDFEDVYLNLFNWSEPIGLCSRVIDKETIGKITGIDDLERKFCREIKQHKYYSKKKGKFIDLAYIIGRKLTKEDCYLGEDIKVHYRISWDNKGTISLKFDW